MAPFVPTFGPKGGYPLLILTVGDEVVYKATDKELREFGFYIQLSETNTNKGFSK